MLRRVGLPEVHARFAPWFLKSNQIQLNRWSAVLFNRLEQAFFAVPDQLSTVEIRMLAHQKHYDAIMKPPPKDLAAPDPSKALEPRQKSQILLQRAFRDCSFHVDEDIARRRQQQAAITGVKKPPPKPKNPETSDNQEDEVDKLEIIPEVAMVNAPPGLAPQVRGQLEFTASTRFTRTTGAGKMEKCMALLEFTRSLMAASIAAGLPTTYQAGMERWCTRTVSSTLVRLQTASSMALV